jgi:hypothetical protein
MHFRSLAGTLLWCPRAAHGPRLGRRSWRVEYVDREYRELGCQPVEVRGDLGDGRLGRSGGLGTVGLGEGPTVLVSSSSLRESWMGSDERVERGRKGKRRDTRIVSIC